MHPRGRRAEFRPFRHGRNPFQTWVVAAATITGIVALLPVTRSSGVVERYLPAWAVLPWYLGLVVGGALALLGTILPARNVPRYGRLLGIEQVGLTVLGALLLSYGAAIQVVVPGVLSGLTTLALGVACAVRWRQAARERRALQHLVEGLVERERGESASS